MRKVLAWMMSALMLVGALGATSALATDGQTAGGGWVPEIEPLVLEDPIGVQEGTKLVVGTTSRMSGKFATDMWGTNNADMDVRALLHGYETVSWSRYGSMQFNSVVLKSVNLAIDNRDYAYTLEIYDDLRYSDGSIVTAQDYVFGLLMSCVPEIAELGGTPQGLSRLRGYDAYMSGESETFEGVRLLSDTEFQLIVPSNFLPYFFGVAMLQAQPYPMAVIAPGCEIRDDGQGVYIAAQEELPDQPAEGYVLGEFSTDMLRETLLNPEIGYIYNPQVVSGPYALESYDMETSTASFLANPYFKGNALGKKPNIERIEMRLIAEEDALALLESGEVGLVNKMMDDSVILPGMDLLDAEAVKMSSYPRSGMAFLAFACERAPADSKAVRQALMMAIDKDAIVANSPETLSATRVEGYYGLGQWMAGYVDNGMVEEENGFVSVATLPPDQAMSIPELLEEMRISVDVEGAIALLEKDGWTVNEAGEPFDPERDTMRYQKQKDGSLQPLMFRVAMADEMNMSAVVCDELERALPLLGAGVEISVIPFPELLEHYYRQIERVYDIFFMGTNFNYLFDPYYYFHTDPVYQGMLNTSGLQDEELMELALDMRNTPTLDLRAYAERWIKFQERFTEMAPMIPLYSNIYFDFYRPDLWGYNPITSAGWSLAIPYAYISDVPLLGEDEEDLSLEEIGADGEVVDGEVVDGDVIVDGDGW